MRCLPLLLCWVAAVACQSEPEPRGLQVRADAAPLQAAHVAQHFRELTLVTEDVYGVPAVYGMLCSIPPVAPDHPLPTLAEDDGVAITGVDFYVNELAARALDAGSFPLPEGAVIVKHKLGQVWVYGLMRPQQRGVGIGGMLKRAPGYAPEAGDWEYFYVDGQGTLTTGRQSATGTSCVGCHAQRDKSDGIFGYWNPASLDTLDALYGERFPLWDRRTDWLEAAQDKPDPSVLWALQHSGAADRVPSPSPQD